MTDHKPELDVDYEALIFREEAEQIVHNLDEFYTEAQESWDIPPELKCAKGETPKHFLVGGDSLECWDNIEFKEGTLNNFYRIRPSEYKKRGENLYYIEAKYNSYERPVEFVPQYSVLLYGKVSGLCSVEVEGSEQLIDDLAGHIL